MKTIITIENYQEIMFRLMEDEFDAPTRTDLIQQIESNELFKFEWEEWKKARLTDPLENYSEDSRELTGKILLIAEKDRPSRKLLIYLMSTAALIALILGIYHLITDSPSNRIHYVSVKQIQPDYHTKNNIPSKKEGNLKAKIPGTKNRYRRAIQPEISVRPADTGVVVYPSQKPVLAEINEILDSASIAVFQITNKEPKKPRYQVRIETVELEDHIQQNTVLAHRGKLIIGKLFTNTQFLIRRKPNGEPDKLILLGEGNNYVCFNINY